MRANRRFHALSGVFSLALALTLAVLAVACSRERLPERIPPSASAKRAVLVQVDGLTPGLLDLYLRSAASRRPGRALAKWLAPGPADGSALTFATGQVHAARLPLPGLSEPSSATLLTGRSPVDVGARNPGDGLAPTTPSLLTLVPHAAGVGFLNTPGLEANDAARVDLARQAASAAGFDGARLLAVRFSGLADVLASRGLAQGPEALGKVDEQLERLLAPPFTSDDTLLVLTSGFGAAPGATRDPVSPGELAKALGVGVDDVVPTGGLLRVARLANDKIPFLAGLAATHTLLRRVGDAMEIYDTDLGRTRRLYDDELTEGDARGRLLAWLKPDEWVAVVDRAGGHEFRRVGEDPARIASGGLADAESLVPVVLAGAALPGAAHVVSLEAVAPATMRLLGLESNVLGVTPTVLAEADALADAARRTRSQNLVDRDRLVLERDAPALEAALGAEFVVRRRGLSEGPALADAALAAVAADARAVVQGAPRRVVIDTALLGAWGGPAQLSLPLDGLDADATATRIRSAVALADGLRALRAGSHPLAAERLRAATDLPAEVAPWRLAFTYWAERAAARATAARDFPPAPAMPVEGPDAAWLSALNTVFELLVPGPTDAEPQRLARVARLEQTTVFTGARGTFAAGLRALFGGTGLGACNPADRGAERGALTAAADAFAVAGEAGLAAMTWQRVTGLASGDAEAYAGAVRRLTAALGAPAAGWTRLDTAHAALAYANFVSGPAQATVNDELVTLTRLYLLKLEQDIVSDRAPGYEGRNIDRVSGFVDGSVAREPALQAEAVAFAIDTRADLQGRLVAALLASGVNLPALLSGRGADSMRSLQRLLDVAATPLPGADTSAPESRLITATADAVAFVAAYFSGSPPVPPVSADESLSGLDLVALRNKSLAETPEGQSTSLLAWGPFIHLVVKAEVALASENAAAAVPVLEGAVDLLGRLGRGEAARAGSEARLGARIDALAGALKAALPVLMGQAPPEQLTAQLAGLDLAPPAAADGVAGRAVALAALAARDAAWIMDLTRRGAAADARLLGGASDLTRALMADADAAGTSQMWRYFTLLLHGTQVALQDAPRWWAAPSLGNILARSTGARAALDEIERRLRAGLGDDALGKALAQDDLGVLIRDQVAFAVSNLDAFAKLAASDAGAEALRQRWVTQLTQRLRLAGDAPGQAVRVRALLHYALAALQANGGKAAELEAQLDAAEKLVAGTALADNAWLFALEAWYAQVSAGHPGHGLAALDRAEKLCPGRAWHLGLARGWAHGAAGDDAGTRVRLEQYVAEARKRGEGGLDVSIAIQGDQGHDQYTVNVSQSLVGLLLGRRAGTFQLGAGARTGEGEQVSMQWAAQATSSPRDAAVRAWTLMALGALLTGDDVAVDAALGRLLTALDGADPAVFITGALDRAGLPSLGPVDATLRDPLTLAWVITLAEARGHLALSENLWTRWKAAVGQMGWAKAVESGDFATLSLCDGEVTGPAGLACQAPRHMELRLGSRAATKAVAALVAARVALLLVPDGETPNPQPARQALVAAGKVAPTLLPAWTRTLFDARAGLKAEAKAAPLPRQAEATWIATHGKMSVREALLRIHTAGGVCEAALRAALLGAPAPNPEAVPEACGAGPLYVVLLLANPQGSASEIVTRTGRALAALEFIGPAQGQAWARQALDQVEHILLVGDDEIRAATFAQSAALVQAARAARADALVATLRAFALAWSLSHGAAPAEAAVDILRDARTAGISGTPAVIFLKHLVFDTGANPQVLAGAFLSVPPAAQAP